MHIYIYSRIFNHFPDGFSPYHNSSCQTSHMANNIWFSGKSTSFIFFFFFGSGHDVLSDPYTHKKYFLSDNIFRLILIWTEMDHKGCLALFQNIFKVGTENSLDIRRYLTISLRYSMIARGFNYQRLVQFSVYEQIIQIHSIVCEHGANWTSWCSRSVHSMFHWKISHIMNS